MKDEEYIKMKLKEGKETEKPVYELRHSDFIPFVGLAKHFKRCADTYISIPFPNELYQSEWFTKEMALGFYNVALITGAIAGATGLVSLLTK